MPANFSSLSQGLHIIPRSEYIIWQHIHAGLPYRLDYGDYTTPPIAEPPSGIRYGFPINVRYTLINSFLICKGVRTKGVGSVLQAIQLRSHASDIKNYPIRHYLNGCWADDEIDQIAAGKSPQGLGYWVTIGVNRHIAITRHMIP
ncbi:beta family protein [Methylobacterium sp. Leaf99]|uniref:beta family protein n=1 Tax=Methylobacterium sp. Leaf99 TaxID=1736251 RepID=UPI003FD419C0